MGDTIIEVKLASFTLGRSSCKMEHTNLDVSVADFIQDLNPINASL
jgi:hypothetical protein